MADLLYNVLLVLLCSVLGLIAIYVVFRVGTLAVLKSIEDQNRKQQLAKEEG